MKSSEVELELKSPILKYYNRSVFYTYIGVIVLAFITAGIFFERQNEQLLTQRDEQIHRHVLQIDLLLESSIRAVKSLRTIATDNLELRTPINTDYLRNYEKFNRTNDYFTLEPKYAESGKPFTNIGRISGKGSLENRSLSFIKNCKCYLSCLCRFLLLKSPRLSHRLSIIFRSVG